MLLLSWVFFPPHEEGKYMKRAKLMSIYIIYACVRIENVLLTVCNGEGDVVASET